MKEESKKTNKQKKYKSKLFILKLLCSYLKIQWLNRENITTVNDRDVIKEN